ncbi:dienelactone hydrolase family protein [Chitinophaga nivalis]|uniref:Dienelactone hydrolase family protein n=1 Tax=Chitinophaga nivalis TaxID=2991709 RepID=A0ABT3IST3_9BACT|nr:dienelactone hydrolase family protein [Chitinophaga nivalis]MCW3463272.1 dienelactone hydrolase family protein [Chitinophaga nivalis]MCW3487038.1 dienelactone hydrolase family protein [Chitinophaga nivalis]
MKKRAIKILSHVCLLSVCLLFACSRKDNEVAPTPEETPVPGVFTPQTVGITAKKMDAKGGNISDYLVYIPDTYNQQPNYKWPVVIFLHGISEMGKDVNILRKVGLVRVVSGKPFVMIAPVCGKNWWNVNSLETLYQDVIKKYNVDTRRVYLTGLSMGGFGTWDWASEKPERFAGIIPICGGGKTELMSRLKKMPIWVFHSKDDSTVKVTSSRVLVKALQELGSTVQYTEYPSGGHDAWTRTYANEAVFTWLLKQYQ